MILYYKLKKYFKANNDLANDIINSLSYKVGYGITYPLRFISDFFKGKKTVLFHNSLPANDFTEKFEQQWVSLVNSAGSFTNNFGKHLEFDLEGNIDDLNKNFVRGWYRNKSDEHERLQVKVFQNKKNIGAAVCDKYRLDLVENKVGDSHYGFKLEFQNPLKKIDDKISIKIFSKENSDSEMLLERAKFIYENGNFQLVESYAKYTGNFDKITDGYACGWVINNLNNSKNTTVLLYRNNELVNTGIANLYRNDLRIKIETNYNKAFRLKIPLVELLKGKAIYKVCTADKFELGRLEWDPNDNDQLINQKLNNLKTDLCLPYYDGFTKPQLSSVSQTIAIHIHVFYVDVFDEICNYVKQLDFNYDLYISTPKSNLKDLDSCLNQHKIVAKKIKQTPNRGRDVAPFIIEFGEDLLNYDIALHLHTKKTNYNASLGKIWMKHILDCLVKDSTYINAVFNIFAHQPNIGVVSPRLLNELVPLYNWGENYKSTKKFLKNLDIKVGSLNENSIEFPAGTMFWFRPKALQKLLKAKLDYKSFPKEPIKGDGSLAHVIERSIYYIAESSGFTYQTIAPINPNLIHNKLDNIIISIIIPVYNSEKWLLQAVQSILQQTQFLEPYEILLVDNNSTDNSTSICKMLSEIYVNINYFFQAKKGAGNARNMGIKKAQGKYLFFLDSDDIIDSRALQNLMDLAYDGTSDLITSPLIIFNEEKFNNPVPAYFTTSKTNIDMKALKTDSNKIDDDTLPYLKAIFSDFGPCAKLYKKEFILNNEILFPEGLNYEDNYFVYKAYLTASKISVCDEPTYLYRKLKGDKGTTQSTSFKETDMVDQFEVMLMLIDLLNQKENRKFKKIGNESIIKKLVWMFNGVPQLPNTDSVIFSKLSNVLSNFSKPEIEKAAEKYVAFLKAVKNKNFSEAISKYDKI